MGDWSDAMEDGVICRGCALPMGDVSHGGYCPDCATGTRGKSSPSGMGPGWLPDQERNQDRK